MNDQKRTPDAKLGILEFSPAQCHWSSVSRRVIDGIHVGGIPPGEFGPGQEMPVGYLSSSCEGVEGCGACATRAIGYEERGFNDVLFREV